MSAVNLNEPPDLGAHEHVWWDQASLLVQVGLLDPGKLPAVGIEQARTLLRVTGKNGTKSGS